MTSISQPLVLLSSFVNKLASPARVLSTEWEGYFRCVAMIFLFERQFITLKEEHVVLSFVSSFEGDQPWNFFGRNDAEAETPVLWPPEANS